MSSLKSTLLSLSVLPTTVNALMVDDFQPIDHNQDFTFDLPISNNSFVHASGGTMLSGERDVEFWNSADAFRGSIYARYELYPFYGRELYRVGGRASFGQGWATVTLQYDGLGDEVGNFGFGKRLRNNGGLPLQLAGVGGFRLWYADDSDEFTVTAILRANGQVIGTHTEGVANGNLQLRSALFPFSNESLMVADSVAFQFNIRLSGGSLQDIYLSHIDTILPEPGTWLAMTGGIALLLGQRRRRRRLGD